MAPYRTILVTTDFSAPSIAAVREAGALAEKLGSRLILAYVVEDRLPPMILAASSEPTEKILDEHRRHAKASLASFAAEHLPGREVDTRVLEGVPWETIVLYAKNEEIDLMLLDIHLPAGGGFKVLERLRASPKKHAMPVIVITADPTSETKRRCYELNCHAYFRKPYHPQRLLEAIELALGPARKAPARTRTPV